MNEDVNAGSDADPDLHQGGDQGSGTAATLNPDLISNPFMAGRALYRAAFAERLGEEAVLNLISKVEAAWQQVRGRAVGQGRGVGR